MLVYSVFLDMVRFGLDFFVRSLCFFKVLLFVEEFRVFVIIEYFFLGRFVFFLVWE